MKSLIIAFAALLIAGCTTVHKLGESGSDRAVLRGPTNIYISSVDGKKDLGQPICTGPICGSGFELGLLPGEHTIVFSAAGYFYTNPLPITYSFRSGGQYRLLVELRGLWYHFRIVEDK